MINLLIHVSNVKVDVLDPQLSKLGYLCFSENIFVSHFGQYIYLFDKKVLEKNFILYENDLGYLSFVYNNPPFNYRFTGNINSKIEYRIYSPINVKKFSLGVITQFNHMRGRFQKRCKDKIIEEEYFDFS